MQRRVGVLGGTFDPIHNAHLLCARQAFDALGLDGVLFLPAATPVFKKDQNVTAPDMRREMCALALEGMPEFSLCMLELEREGDTYTVDTLEQLTSANPDTTYYFIVGMDAFLTLPQWKDAKRLSKLAEFVCVTRPGFSLDVDMLNSIEAYGFRFQILEVDGYDISSTDIRRRVAQGKSIANMVPEAVCDYIAEKKLYALSQDV